MDVIRKKSRLYKHPYHKYTFDFSFRDCNHFLMAFLVTLAAAVLPLILVLMVSIITSFSDSSLCITSSFFQIPIFGVLAYLARLACSLSFFLIEMYSLTF